MSADPRIVRYVLDGAPWSAEKSAEVSHAMVEHWRAHGFGWRVALEKRSGEPVGFVALNYTGDETPGLAVGEFEIGWWLYPFAWGRGLASEGARAQLAEAFGTFAATSVVARLQPANTASAHVATRIGMAHDFDTTGPVGERVAVYRARRG